MSSKEEIVKRLSEEYKKVDESKKSVEKQKVGFNIQITLLERTFLELYSASRKTNQTKMIRKFIHALMKRNQSIVDKAIQIIKEGKNYER